MNISKKLEKAVGVNKKRTRSLIGKPTEKRKSELIEKQKTQKKETYAHIEKKDKNQKKAEKVKLQRADSNPIIEPTGHYWESKATFNPSAIYEDGKVHLVYRAVGDDDVSMLGYATSLDGISIDERLKYPIYRRIIDKNLSDEPLTYESGGGWCGGCEDPRLTLIEDKIYLVYTAFDGWGQIRIALASIKTEDFMKKKWNWSNPIFLSPPDEVHKNWVLFPEKINGKFAILHSIAPKILIEYVDSLDDFNDKEHIKSYFNGKTVKKNIWDNMVRGAGPSPIKTSEGWLLLYHAMDAKDPDRYKLGALLLDLNDPTKVLYRLKHPILEPDETYENEGFKAGVIYSCGAIIKDGNLFVYYGGADKFGCVASVTLDRLLKEMKKEGPVKLRVVKSTMKKVTKKK